MKSLREIIFGTPKPKPVNQTNIIIVKAEEKGYGTKPSTSFANQVDTFLEDPVISQSIQQSAQEICSTGFFTTSDDKYTLILAGKTAKQVIDGWNRDNDIDAKIFQVAVELVAFGNSFWKISDGGFTNIPIQSIEKVTMVDQTTDIRDRYNLQLSATYGGNAIKWGDFLHFRVNLTGLAPLGTGIILGLLETPDDTTPSISEIRNSVRTSMKTGFEKFSFGNEMWSFEGIDSGSTAILSDHIKKMSTTGNRIVTNARGNIILSVPQRTQAYDKWIETIDKEFYMSLGAGINPSTEYTTKATAEAIRTIYEQKIASLRRSIKRLFEDLWIKILDKMGYDGAAAQVKMHFGSKEISYTTPDIFTAVKDKIISADEARKILTEYMGWRLESAAPASLQTQIPEGTKEEAIPEEPQKVDINFRITSDVMKVEPLIIKHDEHVDIKVTAEPLKLSAEPLKISTEPLKIDVVAAAAEENPELVELKKQNERAKAAALNKVQEKVSKL